MCYEIYYLDALDETQFFVELTLSFFAPCTMTLTVFALLIYGTWCIRVRTWSSKRLPELPLRLPLRVRRCFESLRNFTMLLFLFSNFLNHLFFTLQLADIWRMPEIRLLYYSLTHMASKFLDNHTATPHHIQQTHRYLAQNWAVLRKNLIFEGEQRGDVAHFHETRIVCLLLLCCNSLEDVVW